MSMTETLDELQALEQEVAAELEAELAAPKITAAEVGGLDDLDDLLSESLSLRNERGAGKSLRQQLERAQSKEERNAIEATLRAWESRHEWETLANCALFHEQICQCGKTHKHFVGMYYHQKHRRDPYTQRWVAAVQNLTGVAEIAISASVPNRTMIERKFTPVCPECAAGLGFDLSKAEEPWKC